MAAFWLYTFPKSQWFAQIPEPKTSFENQTVIVTGSNTGLGFEAARHVARLGAAKVILACRTIAKGEAAASIIVDSSAGAVERSSIEVWELDVSSFKSIKAFADRVQNLERLDAVIQNAGIMAANFTLVEESGAENHLTTNVMGPIFLGLLLLPKLRDSAKKTKCRGRLTFVGSDLQYIAKLTELKTEGSLCDALNDPKIANMADRYPTTKLLLFLTIREIAARSPISEESNVIITCQTPGLCYSDIARDPSLTTKTLLVGFTAAFARSTEVGGRTLVHAVSPDLEAEAHGKFLMDCKIGADGAKVDSEEGRNLQKRFTSEIFAKLQEIQPGVTTCLS